MIYQLYETQRALLEPYAEYARAASKLYRNPLNPLKLFSGAFTPRIASAYDLMYRLGKDYVKPEFGIREVMVDGEAVGIHERIAQDFSSPVIDQKGNFTHCYQIPSSWVVRCFCNSCKRSSR